MCKVSPQSDIEVSFPRTREKKRQVLTAGLVFSWEGVLNATRHSP